MSKRHPLTVSKTSDVLVVCHEATSTARRHAILLNSQHPLIMSAPSPPTVASLVIVYDETDTWKESQMSRNPTDYGAKVTNSRETNDPFRILIITTEHCTEEKLDQCKKLAASTWTRLATESPGSWKFWVSSPKNRNRCEAAKEAVDRNKYPKISMHVISRADFDKKCSLLSSDQDFPFKDFTFAGYGNTREVPSSAKGSFDFFACGNSWN